MPIFFRLLVCLGILGLPFARAQASAQAAQAGAKAPVRVLIIDGQNNHLWRATTPLLRRILEGTGRFQVDISTTPTAPVRPALSKDASATEKAAHELKLKDYQSALAEYQSRHEALWSAWRPVFSNYAVVLSNYNGESWPEAVKAAFVEFVRNGGGFVSYHAADNAFPEWPEYNEMIGLGGWGNRTEKDGPYLRLREGKWTRDMTPGRGGAHGPQHEFLVETQDPNHPVMRGLPLKWMHAQDELYDSLRGPAKNLIVLASARSPRTQEEEPLLMAITYGRGRVFHTALGHGMEALQGRGFQLTLARGTEWAATGKVTLPGSGSSSLSDRKATLQPVTASP
ncbi:MAG: ThuA domain-containing protein [Opitutaceae bacterium]|nr:ThuA domain-containing protein [Opitutaceae bacterium]